MCIQKVMPKVNVRRKQKMVSEKLKRLKFIKKHSPRKFEQALKSGSLVPTAYEMNKLYPSKKGFPIKVKPNKHIKHIIKYSTK